MAAGNVEVPVVGVQHGRYIATNLVEPRCEAPVEHLEDKRIAVEGRRDPVVGEAGGVPWFRNAEGGVASTGGGCKGGGGYRGASTGQWTAIEDHASREEKDDEEGFYDDTKGRWLRIQVTIVRKRLKEGGSGSPSHVEKVEVGDGEGRKT